MPISVEIRWEAGCARETPQSITAPSSAPKAAGVCRKIPAETPGSTRASR